MGNDSKRIRELEDKLAKTTDRRARAGYRAELDKLKKSQTEVTIPVEKSGERLRSALTGTERPLAQAQQKAQERSVGTTQRAQGDRLPETVRRGIETSAAEQRARKTELAQRKLDGATDRRARAAYRQELEDVRRPLSPADRALPTMARQEIQAAKRLWERGEALRRQGRSAAGSALQEQAHRMAERQRNDRGYSGGASGADQLLPELTGKDRYLTEEGQRQLRAWKLRYEQAARDGDRAGMESARDAAQALREEPGAWDTARLREGAARDEERYTAALALLERQARYDRTSGARGRAATDRELAEARQTVTELEEQYPELGRSGPSRAGLMLRGAAESTAGSLAEAAGWLMTPAQDGRSYRDRLTGDWTDSGRLEAAARAMYERADELLGRSDEDLWAAKFGLGALGDLAVDVGTFGAQMVPELALGAATGGVGGLAAMGARAFGGGAHAARMEGASYGQQGLYGLGSALTEVATEKLFSVAAPFRRAYGGGARIGGRSLDDLLVDAIGRVTRDGKAAQLIASATTEGLEEVVADAVDPVLRSIYDGKTPVENYREEDVTDWLYDGLVGAILGGLGGAAGQVARRGRTDPLRQAAEEMTARVENAKRLGEERTEAPQDARSAAAPAAREQGAARTDEEGARAQLTKAGAELGEHGRKALTAAYEDGTDTAAYFGGFSVLYEAGKAGKAADAVVSPLVQQLTASQKLAAYAAGQNDGRAETPTAGLAPSAAAKRLDRGTARQLDDMGKALGTTIHVVERADARGADGWYDRRSGSITVVAGSGKSVMTVAKHEITHRMQDLAPEAYAAYRDHAARILGGAEGTERLVAAYRERYARAGVDLSEEEALDEAAADLTQAMTTDPALFERLAEERPGVARRLLEAVKEVLARLRAALRGETKQDRAAAERYGVTVRQLEEAARLWERALKAGAETAQTRKAAEAKRGNGGRRYSIDPDFGGEIDAWNGESGKTFRVGRTSAALRSIGVRDKTIIWHSGKIARILEKHRAMTRDVVKQVPNILEDPVIVLGSKNSSSRIVVFGEVTDSSGDPVTAILELQPTGMGGEIMDMNVIASAYGKDSDPAEFIRSSGVLYLDPNKTRTERWLHSIGLRSPSGLTTLGPIGSIAYQDGKVKLESVPAPEVVEFSWESGERLSQSRRGGGRRYSIDPDFGGRIAAWDRAGRPEGERFALGSTGPVLQGLGAIESDIYMDGDKIEKILHDHPEMTIREIRHIPEILEDPVLVLKSKNKVRSQYGNSRLVVFGAVRARDGRPILCVLDLRPTENGFLLDDMQKVASAYTKDGDPVGFFQRSEVLYADAKRTTQLLRGVGFTRPASLLLHGPIGSISYDQKSVKLSGAPFSSVVDMTGGESATHYSFGEARAQKKTGQSGNSDTSTVTPIIRGRGEKVKEDGRYSLAGEDLLEAQARAKALEVENELLRERVAYFRGQMRRSRAPKTDPAAVRRQARALRERYQATVPVDELEKALQGLWDRMAGDKELGWAEAYREAEQIAAGIAKSAVEVHDELYQEYADLRKWLRETPLRISKEESEDVPDYAAWRKRYFGRLRVARGRTNVDQVYQELGHRWPEFFPQGEDGPTAPADQLLHIAWVADDLYTITEGNPYAGEMAAATRAIADDVLAAFFETPQVRATFADREQAKLDRAIAKGRRQTGRVLERERAARKREVKQVMDRYWDMRRRDVEDRAAVELRGRIIRHAEKLSQKLLRPTDKQRIPEKMRFAVAGVLESIDLTSAYANGPQKEVQIIPAKKDLIIDAEKKKLRVCAYCRVSTEEDNQASSYELQVQNYTKMIQENPEWEFAGIFADEGISGTSVLHREHFLEMIEKCKTGEIDLIITKQVSRFARNVLDSLNYIFMLRKLDPPVGVYFETEKLNTLDRSSDK